MSKKSTFRLVLVAMMIVLPLLTSCAAPTPQVVEKVVTQVVEFRSKSRRPLFRRSRFPKRS